jgi:uncharacterized protein (DUF433 family)
MDNKLIISDPEVMGGTPVFSGTRVPVKSLFDHIELSITIEDFLEDFPSVKKGQVVELLHHLKKISSIDIFKDQHEAFA